MPLTLVQKLQFAWNRFCWELVPPLHARKPITWRDVPNAFAYILVYVFMAYLVRRRDTWAARLLLLPSAIYLTLRGTFYYDFPYPEFAFLNFCRGIIGLSLLALCIDFAFARNGRLKIGEKQLVSLRDGSPRSSHAHSVARFFPTGLVDATEAATTLRWIGWEIGKGVSVPPEFRPKARSAFLKTTAWLLVGNFLVVDLLVASIKLLPGIGSPAGSTIFLSHLPLLQRYTFSTILTAVSGTAMVAGFNALNYFGTLIAVGILGQSPEQWPPLTNSPWSSQSISDLWAKRWHQMLRRVFLVYGGIPGGWIAGRAGLVLGTFLASGLLHEFSLYVIGRGIDHRVTFFFTFQGVCVMLEVLWRSITGCKVRGWGGRLWTYAIVLGTGQLALDAWLMRGLGGSVFIPECMSPAQLFIIPTLRRLVESKMS